jgi:hypothetical protein
MHSSVRTDESHENARLENAQMIQKKKAQARHIVTGLSVQEGANLGLAVVQRLDAGFPPRRPGFAYGHHVGFVVDKAALGQVFSEYFDFPCQAFHRFLHYHNHQRLTQ